MPQSPSTGPHVSTDPRAGQEISDMVTDDNVQQRGNEDNSDDDDPEPAETTCSKCKRFCRKNAVVCRLGLHWILRR